MWVTHYSLCSENPSQSIKFIKKSWTIFSHMSKSPFKNLKIKVTKKYDWHLYSNLWKYYLQSKFKFMWVKLTAQIYIKLILIWEQFSQLTKTMKFLLKTEQYQIQKPSHIQQFSAQIISIKMISANSFTWTLYQY